MKSKSKAINIILDILLIVICIYNVIVNMDNYKAVLLNDYNQVKKLNDLNNNFVYVNLKEAKQENYSITDDKEKIDIYTYNINDENILILLKENTIITDKTPMQVIKDNYTTIDIKEKLKDNNYYSGAISNIDYNNNRKIELVKIYIIIGIIIYSILSIIVNSIMLIKLMNKKSVY